MKFNTFHRSFRTAAFQKNNHRMWFFIVSLVGIFWLGFRLISPVLNVSAQDYTASDVFFAMNDIRAVFGLEPYVMRDDLMQLAQAHAEYMAEIQVLTHTRADGSQPNVTAENVSLGPIQIAVNTWMDDQPHKDTILAWSSGWAGAGIALSDNGYVYISFDMIRMPDAVYNQIFDPYPPIATEDPNLPTLAPGEPTRTPVPGVNQFINAVEIATPDADGYIWHTVKNGQTLWAIAEEYAVSQERIAGLNSLDLNNPVIYTGRKLLIDIVDPPLPTATLTVTTEPTATQTPTQTLTPSPEETNTPTQLPVTEISPVQSESPRKNVPYLIPVGVVILGGMLMLGYKKGWIRKKM